MSRPIRVGITHGDYNGIGYEVILKALSDPEITTLCTPVIFGNSDIARKVCDTLQIDDVKWTSIGSADEAADGEISIIDVCSRPDSITPGHPTPEAGRAAAEALEAACKSLEEGKIDVLVTAPINKRTIYNPETFPYPGHTEYLEARIGKGEKATMILFDDMLRVALVSTHKALRDVPATITRENVTAKIEALDKTLRRDFGMDRPRIAVLSLNPHNGDNGLLGSEEIQIITPAIEDCIAKGILAFGPYAADGFFGNGTFRNFDGIVAMYHDQGLAPFKALAGEYGVNYTAGLPYVRTSPDHGTGYDIAGKGTADPLSMRQAIFKAIDLYRNRATHDRISANPLRITRQQPERQ